MAVWRDLHRGPDAPNQSTRIGKARPHSDPTTKELVVYPVQEDTDTSNRLYIGARGVAELVKLYVDTYGTAELLECLKK